MKYRLLTDEELSLLENDLKQFLVVNQVYKEEWARMNAESPELAAQMIELFSDSVLQIVYEKVRFLEHRAADSCFVFQCHPDKLELIAIQRKDQGIAIDLSTPGSIHDALVNHPDQLTFFRHEKPYAAERETEIHRMLEQGCVNSSESFWKALAEVVEA